MSEDDTFENRQRKLKENLYRILKDEPEGIETQNLWSWYGRKTGESGWKRYYGVKKMKNLLEMFSDVFCEVRCL